MLNRPFPHVERHVLHAAAQVELLILDVDGVLTDGGVYYAPDGGVTKRFNVQDGLGAAILRKVGISIGVITGMNVSCVEARLKDMKVADYYCGQLNKIAAFEEMQQKYALEREKIAFVGDDWIDVPAMRRSGFPVATVNAQPEVKEEALYITEKQGGEGAVREVARLLLHARGKLDDVFAEWAGGVTL